MKIALIQQHSGPSVAENIERGINNFEKAVYTAYAETIPGP